jgi:hypothetical protein
MKKDISVIIMWIEHFGILRHEQSFKRYNGAISINKDRDIPVVGFL